MSDETLWAAARAAYEEKGPRLSLSEIARAAGVSRQTAHQRLGAKAALLARLAQERGEDGAQDVDSRIMDAVLAIASLRGFRGATLEEIAERAGVAPVTIYRRYGGKDELIAAFVQARSPRAALVELMDEAREASHEALRDLTARALGFMSENRELVRLVLSGSADDRAYLEGLRDAAQSTFGRMIGFFARLQQRGVVGERLTPEELAVSYLGMLHAHAVLVVGQRDFELARAQRAILILLEQPEMEQQP
jgi:AcrR family transcriptional regulator